MKAARAISVLLGLAATACGHPGVDLAKRPRRYKSSDYEKVLARWTRSGRIFDHFDTNLKVWATYFSWDFTSAYAVRYARMFRLPNAEALALKRKLMADKSKVNEFYLAVTTQELRWNDLDQEDSIWKLRLITDRGATVAPTNIERIVPVKAVHRALFPYTKTFYYAYVVRFPMTASGHKVMVPSLRWFGLRFSGPKGTLTLQWKVRH